MIKMNKAISLNFELRPFFLQPAIELHTGTSIQSKSLCWDFAFCNNELLSVEIWSSRRYFFPDIWNGITWKGRNSKMC